MPKNSWTLTRSKKSDYRKVIEQMRAVGADLDPSAFGEGNCEWIKVTPCPPFSYLRTWTGATVFVIHVRMVGLAPQDAYPGVRSVVSRI